MSDLGDIERLKQALERGWLTQDQYHHCFVQSQMAQCSALDIALKLNILDSNQLGQLQPSQPSRRPSDAPETGQYFDDYMIVRELGRGGMGAVYHGQKNGIDYALKFLLNDSSDQERFEREAAALAQVDRHPNVVSIHSYKQHGARRYIVFDLLTGGDLKSRLSQRERFPEEEALKLAKQVANALSHIHRNGFLHRDLKPENILFHGDSERPLISDFGLAYSTQFETLTLSGELLGTPTYMAPEQFETERGDLGPGTDLWALGAILYEMLSGQKAFPGKSILQLANSVLTKNAPRVRSARPELSEGVENIILRALEKDPADRFQSAADFEEACQEALDRGYELQALPSQQRRAKRRTLGILASLMILGLSIGALFYGQELDEALYQARLSPEIKAQSKRIEQHLKDSEASLTKALAQWMLHSAGQRVPRPPAKALIPKDPLLLKSFDAHLSQLKEALRLFKDPQLETLEQRRSVLLQYWRSSEAKDSSQVKLEAQLPKEWRSLFGSHQLFKKEKYSEAKESYLQGLTREKSAQDTQSALRRPLFLLGLALCAAKQRDWRQAENWFRALQDEAITDPWLAQLSLLLKEQRALDSLLTETPRSKEKEGAKALPRALTEAWIELLEEIEKTSPSAIDGYWANWNRDINQALSKGMTGRTILLFCDFLAQYWLEKPSMIKAQFNHKQLRTKLLNLFQMGQSRAKSDIYGTVFNHFLSIRQFDRTFKMDLTFLTPSKRLDAGVLGKVETEIDWYQSITRIAHADLLDFQSNTRKDSLPEILFQTSLVASRQGLYLPLDRKLVFALYQSGTLQRAIDKSQPELDPYPLFWRTRLNPFDFRSTPKDAVRLYLQMNRDIETLLRVPKLLPRFKALLLRKKAEWHYSALRDVLDRIITSKELGRSMKALKAASAKSIEEALSLPHFKADKAYSDFAQYFPEDEFRKRDQYFKQVLIELDKRQRRTQSGELSVGRTLGEVILPVRDYKKTKSRYLLYYAEALQIVGKPKRSLQVAESGLGIHRERMPYDKVMAQCYVNLQDWPKLERLLKKRRKSEQKEIIMNLISRFQSEPAIIAEIKRRFGKGS